MEQESVYKVEGMTCGGCAASITRAIQRVGPSLGVDVDLAAGRVRVTGDHDEQAVAKAVQDAGFDFGGRAGA